MFSDDFFMNPMESMRRMDSMMDSMMAPFGMQRNRGMLMPFGFGGSLFPSMDGMYHNFNNLNNLQPNPDCHSFSSSSVMTYSTDGTGRPQVYQASASTRTGPGGVKETRRSVQDSRTGLQEMAIGHHLLDKGHVVEKKRYRYTGDEEENEEFVNLEDDETDRFEQEWRERAQSSHMTQDNRLMQSQHQQPQLAITDGATRAPALDATSPKKKSGKHKKKHHAARPTPYQ